MSKKKGRKQFSATEVNIGVIPEETEEVVLETVEVVEPVVQPAKVSKAKTPAKEKVSKPDTKPAAKVVATKELTPLQVRVIGAMQHEIELGKRSAPKVICAACGTDLQYIYTDMKKFPAVQNAWKALPIVAGLDTSKYMDMVGRI